MLPKCDDQMHILDRPIILDYNRDHRGRRKHD